MTRISPKIRARLALIGHVIAAIFRNPKSVYTAIVPSRGNRTLIPPNEISALKNCRSDSRVAFVIHVHYEEYIPRIKELIDIIKSQNNISVYISTTSRRAENEFRLAMANFPNLWRVAHVPNRGRNFGPLLVEFSESIASHDLLIHLHSKKSLHAPNGIGEFWSKKSWDLFAKNQEKLKEALSIFDFNSGVGIVYASADEYVNPLNFLWGGNIKPLKKIWNLISDKPLPRTTNFVYFPAGGMFAVRTEPLKRLLELNWDYGMFPIEAGQLDGTIQHAIERVIGQLVTDAGLSHVVYDSAEQKFFALGSQIHD